MMLLPAKMTILCKGEQQPYYPEYLRPATLASAQVRVNGHRSAGKQWSPRYKPLWVR